MFLFKRLLAGVMAGLATALIGILLDLGFTGATAINHAAAVM
jgi:hypothetical protein